MVVVVAVVVLGMAVARRSSGPSKDDDDDDEKDVIVMLLLLLLRLSCAIVAAVVVVVVDPMLVEGEARLLLLRLGARATGVTSAVGKRTYYTYIDIGVSRCAFTERLRRHRGCSVSQIVVGVVIR